MFNLSYFNSESFLIRTCRSNDLDDIDIKCSVETYEAGKKCKDILPNAKTVIIIGNVISKEQDTVKRGILGDDFPCYKASREKAKEIAKALHNAGYNAKVTVGISIKNACVLSGMGVYGKSSLIINPDHGTLIRYCCIVTDWVPDEYSKPLNNFNPCNNCNNCITSCPTKCLSDYSINGLKCECTYIKKGMKLLKEYPMCSICQDVCEWNKR